MNLFRRNAVRFQETSDVNTTKHLSPIPSKPYPFITCFLMGGLGNQLFQIFATMAYALQYNYGYIFPYSETLKTGIERPTYWNTLFDALKSSTIDAQRGGLFDLPRYNEIRYFKYYPIPPSAAPGLLVGYFQSYKYFAPHYDKIVAALKLREKQQRVREMFFGDDDGGAVSSSHMVSMHFRIGDYAEKQDHHPVMKYEYYERALAHICTQRGDMPIVILYFCEKENNAEVASMIALLQANAQTATARIFVKVDDNISDWEQLLLMSCCDDHIIGNSTFSWWGAYLNERSDKIVCYPRAWLGPALLRDGYDIDDLVPPSWDGL